MGKDYLFTSESVSKGHPDKVADQISDAVLDAMLAVDKYSRVACETMVTTGMALVAGEITCSGQVPIADLVRKTIKEIGYTDPAMGFDYQNCAVLQNLDKQSPDISQGVTSGEGLHKEQGAGDQGLMFGYACNETPELMPMPIQLAQTLVAKMAEFRENGSIAYLRPDSKSQVTIEYKDDKPSRIHTVVISTQHGPDVAYETIKSDMIEKICGRVLPSDLTDENTIYHINPTGRFVVGGPYGDCGLTGRKLIVDTYGGMGRHGGGAFSGKDPSKVDRSAAYATRWVAKNVVAAGLAEKCEVQVAYAIGVADPLSIHVDTFGTGTIPEDRIVELISKNFDLRPAAIIERLDLLRPIYKATAAHGHFGRHEDTFTWEKADVADELKKQA